FRPPDRAVFPDKYGREKRDSHRRRSPEYKGSSAGRDKLFRTSWPRAPVHVAHSKSTPVASSRTHAKSVEGPAGRAGRALSLASYSTAGEIMGSAGNRCENG